jgi:hypothetical protein
VRMPIKLTTTSMSMSVTPRSDCQGETRMGPLGPVQVTGHGDLVDLSRGQADRGVFVLDRHTSKLR